MAQEVEPVPEVGLTTGALARRLGVSPTTLRSWDRRYGIGTAVRTEGRHRRWSPEDVAVLEAMCRLTSAGVPPAEAARAARGGADVSGAANGEPEADGRSRAAGALPLGDVRQECRGLARAAVRLDAPAVDELLTAAVDRHGVVGAWQDVMMPVLHAVGRKWETSGDRYVEVEHLLSWHVSTALRRATRRVDSPAAPPEPAPAPAPGPVVLACVPGEQHTLALEALTAALSERDVPARMFGAAVPAEALTAAVRRLGPTVVVLWAQARSTASAPLAAHIAGTGWGARGARRRPLVVLAGTGWAGSASPGMPRPGGLQEALELVSGVY
ncbi:MerR family transcriptional regulator [Streptomyces chromofuscus]|uniref:MerR family transcriptional regulator n=1 Tax=Streptomyces chromofuscus TaxID=42881 RepID=A0A7M2TFH8_STRCW|nr:MerR family transcriptional regulator [Streptomyces chromofuscus]QOV46498.1 MerR family transcriptional regulator [Streptomyces chromofuscus]GGS93801.1 transcriptional regulator [Streptomyces chromofuscus]